MDEKMQKPPEDPDFLSELIPFRCPKCGNLRRFPTLRELKLHLESEHSYRVGYIRPRPRARPFGGEKQKDGRSPVAGEKAEKDWRNAGRSSPLLQSYKEEAGVLELELQMAKQHELRNKTESLKGLTGKAGSVDVKGALNSLNREVMKSRDTQWRTADALYQSQDILNDMETAAEEKCREQRDIIAALVVGMKEKGRELSAANKEQDDLKRERQRLLQETEQLFLKADDNTQTLTSELNRRESAIDSLNTEMSSMKSRYYQELQQKDGELQTATRRMERLQTEREQLLVETDKLLKLADKDGAQMRSSLVNKEQQLHQVNAELDTLRWDQQATLEKCIELYRKADEGTALLKGMVQTKDNQLREALEQLARMKEVQSRLVSESDILTQQADDNSETMKKILERKENQVAEANQELERLKSDELLQADQERLKHSTTSLAEKAEKSCTVIENLQQLVGKKKRELKDTKSELQSLKTFIQDAAEKERTARGKLEKFIGELIDRASRAESRLRSIQSQSSSSGTETKGQGQHDDGNEHPVAMTTKPKNTAFQPDYGRGEETTPLQTSGRVNRNVTLPNESHLTTSSRGNPPTSTAAMTTDAPTVPVSYDTTHQRRTQEPIIDHRQDVAAPARQEKQSQPPRPARHLGDRHKQERGSVSDDTAGRRQGPEQVGRSPARKRYKQGARLAAPIVELGIDPWHQDVPSTPSAASHSQRTLGQGQGHRYTDDDSSEFMPEYVPIDETKQINRNIPIPKRVSRTGVLRERPQSNRRGNTSTVYLTHGDGGHVQVYSDPSTARGQGGGIPAWRSGIGDSGHGHRRETQGRTAQHRQEPVQFSRIPVPPSSSQSASHHRPAPASVGVGKMKQELERQRPRVDGDPVTVRSSHVVSRPPHSADQHALYRASPEKAYTWAELRGHAKRGTKTPNNLQQYQRAQRPPSPSTTWNKSPVGQGVSNAHHVHATNDMYQPNPTVNFAKQSESVPLQTPVHSRTGRGRWRDPSDHQGLDRRSRSVPAGPRYRRLDGPQNMAQAHDQDDSMAESYRESREAIQPRDIRALSVSPLRLVLPDRRAKQWGPALSDSVTSDEAEERDDRNFERIMDDNGILWDDMDTLPDVSDSELDRVSPYGSEAIGTKRVVCPPTNPAPSSHHVTPALVNHGSSREFYSFHSDTGNVRNHTEKSGRSNTDGKDTSDVQKPLQSQEPRTVNSSRHVLTVHSKHTTPEVSNATGHAYTGTGQTSEQKAFERNLFSSYRDKIDTSGTPGMEPLGSPSQADILNSSRGFKPIQSSETAKSSLSEHELTSGGKEVHSVLRNPLSSTYDSPGSSSKGSSGRGSSSLGTRPSGIGRSVTSEPPSDSEGLKFDEKLRSIAEKYSSKRREIAESRSVGRTSSGSERPQDSKHSTPSRRSDVSQPSLTGSTGLKANEENGSTRWRSDVNVKSGSKATATRRSDISETRPPRRADNETVCSEEPAKVSADPARQHALSGRVETKVKLESRDLYDAVPKSNLRTVEVDVHPVPTSIETEDAQPSSRHSQLRPTGSIREDNSSLELTEDPVHSSLLLVRNKLYDDHCPSTSVSENFSMFAEPVEDARSVDGESSTQSMLDQASMTDTELDTDPGSHRPDRGPGADSCTDMSGTDSRRYRMSSASSQASIELLERVPGSRREAVKQRRQALFYIFTFLDTRTLGRVAEVCREWKIVSRNPRLWSRIELKNGEISHKFLCILAKRCSKLKTLILEDLRPRDQGKAETLDVYTEDISCYLDPGLEQILKKSESSLTRLSVINCGRLLSSKCLWEASCYSRLLRHVTYISDSFPLGPEVMWALGSGCRDLRTLEVAPQYPCLRPDVFSTKCVHLIGKCFPDLEVLSIGGLDLDLSALTGIAKNCQRLRSMELNHMSLVTMATTVAMSDNGLQCLQVISFMATPVETGAVQIFYDTCRHLQQIKVHVTEEAFQEGTKHLAESRVYKEEMDRLHELQKKPGIGNVLQLC